MRISLSHWGMQEIPYGLSPMMGYELFVEKDEPPVPWGGLANHGWADQLAHYMTTNCPDGCQVFYEGRNYTSYAMFPVNPPPNPS